MFTCYVEQNATQMWHSRKKRRKNKSLQNFVNSSQCTWHIYAGNEIKRFLVAHLNEQAYMMVDIHKEPGCFMSFFIYILIFLFSEFNTGHIRQVPQELLHKEDFECALCMRLVLVEDNQLHGLIITSRNHVLRMTFRSRPIVYNMSYITILWQVDKHL